MNAPLPSLSPLIKWAGGKRSELPVLRPAYPPNISRIIEPFAGGAAVSLDMNPGRAVLGDVSTDLVDFYQVLGTAGVREEMISKILDIQKIRQAVAKWVGGLTAQTVAQVAGMAMEAQRQRAAKKPKVKSNKSGINDPGANNSIGDDGHTAPINVIDPGLIRQWVKHLRCGTDEQNQVMTQWLVHDIEASLRDKMSRVDKVGKGREQGAFNSEELRPHLLTAIHAGVYTSLRRVYNHQPLVPGIINNKTVKKKKSAVGGGLAESIPKIKENPDLSGDRAWRVACWYVVRNLCYAGMFRFGPGGKFNVPYGGISYNSRDFSKVEVGLLNENVQRFFDNSNVHLMDFDQLMDTYGNFGGAGSGDFIFLDPPYDSAFSQYNSEGDFTQDDQRRLAARLQETTTPWMLVIKNTEFILSLYGDMAGRPPLYRALFDKSYQVNIRNRNNADVEHLVVTNYPLPLASTVEGGGGLSPIP